MINSMIWGIVLIMVGLSFLAKSFLGPIIRLLIAGILIYAGISMITKLTPDKLKKQETVLFAKKTIDKATKPKDYSVLFGQGLIDLSDIEPPKKPITVEINTVFGTNRIKINPKIPTKITATTAFGSTQLPDDTLISFGKYTYKTAKKMVIQHF